MLFPGLLVAAGVSVAPVELLLGGSGSGREQHTVDNRGGQGNSKNRENLFRTSRQLKI